MTAAPSVLLSYPNDTQVTVGSSIALICTAQGFPLPQVTWQMNGMSISTDRFTITMRNVDVPPSSVVSTLDLRDVQLVNTGEYQCRATNNLTASSDTSENFNLTVLSKCAMYNIYQ